MISLLSNLPFVSTVFSKFSKKKRLFIEYALLALLITVSGFTFTLWLSKIKTERTLADTTIELLGVQSRLTTVESINATNEETIKELKSLRTADAKALGVLLSDFRELSAKDVEVRNRLRDLEKSNENVRNYLNSPIPPELVCLLNDSCEAGTDSGGENRKSNPAK